MCSTSLMANAQNHMLSCCTVACNSIENSCNSDLPQDHQHKLFVFWPQSLTDESLSLFLYIFLFFSLPTKNGGTEGSRQVKWLCRWATRSEKMTQVSVYFVDKFSDKWGLIWGKKWQHFSFSLPTLSSCGLIRQGQVKRAAKVKLNTSTYKSRGCYFTCCCCCCGSSWLSPRPWLTVELSQSVR